MQERFTSDIAMGFHKLILRVVEKTTRKTYQQQSGVGMFIKENINYKIREDLSGFIRHIFESIFVKTSSSLSKSKIVGVVVYRPNSQPRADLNIFISTFEDMMRIMNTEHCTIMGDFNIDLLTYTIYVFQFSIYFT